MQLLVHVGISALFTAVIECFLVLNIGSYTNYLVQIGNDNPLVQRFAFVSTVSILLFVDAIPFDLILIISILNL